MDEQTLARIEASLERLQSGDDTATHELVGCAHAHFRTLASRMLRRHFARLRGHDTDSIISRSWPRLERALRATRPATIRALFQLTSHVFRQSLLTLARQDRHPLRQIAPLEADDDAREGLLLEPGTTTLDPEELAIWEEFHQRVEQLPQAEREVFDLHYYQGLPQAFIARLLELPNERQVSRLWLSATSQLGRWLRQEGFLE